MLHDWAVLASNIDELLSALIYCNPDSNPAGNYAFGRYGNTHVEIFNATGNPDFSSHDECRRRFAGRADIRAHATRISGIERRLRDANRPGAFFRIGAERRRDRLRVRLAESACDLRDAVVGVIAGYESGNACRSFPDPDSNG